MKTIIFLGLIIFLLGGEKDQPIVNCSILSCDGNSANDSIEAYSKIIGTWEWQGDKGFSTKGEIIICPDNRKSKRLIFDETKIVSEFINGKINCSGSYTIDKVNGLYINGNCKSGFLSVCDQYLMIGNSYRDAFDTFYKKVN